jgi:hypothetical protein
VKINFKRNPKVFITSEKRHLEIRYFHKYLSNLPFHLNKYIVVNCECMGIHMKYFQWLFIVNIHFNK